ncbi:MAG: S8 family serine peptidase [Verrucomicrobia bacterium]|nr:S8 family serine peptidase [Verrucomicrobiota bacterium]
MHPNLKSNFSTVVFMRKFVVPLAGFGLLLVILCCFCALRTRWSREDGADPANGAAALRSDTPGRPEPVRAAARNEGPTTGLATATDASTQPSENAEPVMGNSQRAAPVTAAPVSAGVWKQVQALQVAKLRRTPAQQKMDSQLIDGEKMRRGGPLAEGVGTLRVDLDKDDDERVLTDIDAKVSDELLQSIAALGGKVVNHFEQFNAIRARLPLAQIEALAAREDVTFIRPAVEAVTNVGSVTSEGDVAHRADTARTQFNVTGAGVKVGVMSDSVDHLAASQASGDLGTVTVRTGQSGVPGSGEGTAMLEIVHDLAPGAELFYATGFGSPASFAQNIRDLRFANRCDIIIDDVTYFNESGFQDGVIAQAVNAVTADGALFFSSAANSGNKNDNTSGTWEGDFVDGGDFTAGGQSQGRLHSFGTATENIATKGGRINLFWADPLGAAANDYDVYVVNAAGDSIIAAGNTTQNGTQDPYESVPKANDGERILIVKFGGAARYLHLEAGRGRLAISTSGSTRGHNAAKDAFTVAAVDANTSFPLAFTGNTKNPVETFSSDGLRRVFFNADGTPITPGNFSATGGTVWQKPDIAAADGVLTTLPADSGLNPFFGTSAAAPHAGAVAALLKSYNPALTPSQMRSILTGTALDIEAAGADRDSGVGIVMAVQALQAVPSPDQSTITSFDPASGGVGANVIITGTKFNGVTAVQFNGVAATFTVDSATQISTTVPAGATTGRISVTVPAGTATSATDFTVQLTPAITSVTPGSGAVGATVVLVGAHLNGATAVKFNNVNAPGFTVNSAVQITVAVPTGATSGRITVTTPAGTATSPNVFTVTTQPSITSFTPDTGGVGTSVILNGANLTGATAARFNGVSATFTVDSVLRITATVPAGAATGPISVTTPSGTTNSTTSFTVVPVPSLSGFSPASGAPGANVTINGTNFTGATAVRFNGVGASFTANSAVQINATVPAGATTGTLSVTTPGGTVTSATTFTALVPPANDNFANAQVISGNTGTVSGNNAAATKEVNELDHVGNPGGKSVWYRWTAPSAGAWQFTTLGSSFDTVLAVYTGNSVSTLTLIANGDDTAGATNSSLRFVAVAGTVYRIAVDGFRSQGGTAASASSGNVVLNWAATTAPTISGFSPPRGTPGTSVTINGANFNGASAVRFNGLTASFTVNSAVQITATVPANATSGPLEVIAPAGSVVSAASFTVVNAPANDAFASAQVIAGNSGSVSGRNTDASKEVNEPNHAGNPGGRSVWYAWTAPANGLWTFDTQGSNFDTVLGIYTGNPVGALALVASNDDSSPGTISRATFTAVAGTIYRIAVDGRNGDSGTTTLNWAFTPNPPSITSFAPLGGGIGSAVVLTGLNLTGTTGVRLNGVLVTTFTADSATQITLTVPLGVNSGPFSVTTPNGTAVSGQSFTVTSGPANDPFAGAQVLSGSAAIIAGQNVTATKETGEPAHAGDPGERSVWYRWTAPSSGTWALDTAGSSFDTTLAVYTGSAVNALTEVASNDDVREDRTSRLTFTATPGTTYRIAVDGYGGDNGNLMLKLLPTLAPQIIYETGFEAAQGFSPFYPLAGQGGWQRSGYGENGIVYGYFPGSGQQAYLGQTSYYGEDLFLWRPLNFTPQTNSRPVVRFSVMMGIVDSSNFAYDSFDWSVYNLSGQRLFSLDFDNADLSIYYRLDDGTGYHFTGGSFENGTIYELVITMDFARNRWIASLDGEAMLAELPITTTGAALNLGDLDAVWLPADAYFPGNNAMVFDNYRLTAEPSEMPLVVLGPQNQSVTLGSPATFAVVASGGEPLQYQWRFNGSPLPGKTSAVLTLDNVGLGQAGGYSVIVTNGVGSVSSSATLAVNQPGPVNLVAGTRLPDGRFQFTLSGTPGSRVVVEFSADLVQWQNLTTVVLGSGTLVLSDPDTGSQPRRFYRARLQP